MIANFMLLMLMVLPRISFADDIACITKNGKVIKNISLDINGDDIQDSLKLIKNINKKCVVKIAFTPWANKEEKHDVTLNDSVILISIKNNIHIIYDDETPSILSTSTINEISTISGSDIPKEYSDLKAAKGDIIIIPTESGIDSYLLWNGKEYQTSFPNEEP